MTNRSDKDVVWWAAGWLAGIAGAATAALLGASAVVALGVFFLADYCGRRGLPALAQRARRAG